MFSCVDVIVLQWTLLIWRVLFLTTWILDACLKAWSNICKQTLPHVKTFTLLTMIFPRRAKGGWASVLKWKNWWGCIYTCKSHVVICKFPFNIKQLLNLRSIFQIVKKSKGYVQKQIRFVPALFFRKLKKKKNLHPIRLSPSSAIGVGKFDQISLNLLLQFLSRLLKKLKSLSLPLSSIRQCR